MAMRKKKAGRVGRPAGRGAASKGARGKAKRRSRAKLVIVASKDTERAGGRLDRAVAAVEAARKRMHEKLTAARKLAGKGRGNRPANPAAAERALQAARAAQENFAVARSAARDQRKAWLLSRLHDKQRAKLSHILARAETQNAAGAAKVQTKLERAVAKFRASREARLVAAEQRRAKKRSKRAERDYAAAKKRLTRQIARASGQKVRRTKRRAAK